MEEQRGGQRKSNIVTLGSQAAIKKLLAELCPITFQQLVVLLHFIVLVVLWFFREPRCVEVRTLLVTILRNIILEIFQIHVWVGSHVLDDASSAMLIVFLLFSFPSHSSSASGPSPPWRSPPLAPRCWTGSSCRRGSPGASGQCQPGRWYVGGDLLHHGGPHTGHLQRENRQHSAALHGRGSAGHGGEECGVSTPVPG